MPTKPIWMSKIFWLNIIATLTAVLDALKVINLPPEVVQYGVIVLAIANAVLRIWFTDTVLAFYGLKRDGEQVG